MSDLRATQLRVTEWVLDVFGQSVAQNAEERCFRFAEEAIELCQAVGLKPARLHKLIGYVYARPVGEPSQETAGCVVTLCATASALGIDVATATAKELDRIETPEIRAKVLRRQSEKRAAGFTCDDDRGAFTGLPSPPYTDLDHANARISNLEHRVINLTARLESAQADRLPAISNEDTQALDVIRSRLRTQDNAITSDPMFLVEEQERVYGFDPQFDDGAHHVVLDEEGDELTAAEALEHGPDGLTHTAYQDRWKFVTAMLTRDAAEEYCRTQAHRHRGKLRVFVDSAHRNPEWKLLRRVLAGLPQVGADTPWPLRDVLAKLIGAAECLLHEYNYDRHGWESIDHALRAARAYLKGAPDA